jgi:hypothetical protein
MELLLGQYFVKILKYVFIKLVQNNRDKNS